MPSGHSRHSIILAMMALAWALPGAGRAQAQYFPFFGAPQQINTARGSIQLAPGWHVATTPVRAGQGYRVAVRSDYGEQRNMFIGANGALAVENGPRAAAPRGPSRPLTKIEAPRQVDAKPKTKVAVIRAPGKPSGATAASGAKPAPIAVSAPAPRSPASPSNDAAPKAQAPDPMGPQAPGFAHGVPINPLD